MKSSQSSPLKSPEKLKAMNDDIVKEASELSTLCGVDVGLIMYHRHDPKPDVWCSKPGSIHSLLAKHAAESSKRAPPKPDSQFIDGLGVEELTNLDRFLADKLDKVNERINLMKGNASAVTDQCPEGRQGGN